MSRTGSLALAFAVSFPVMALAGDNADLEILGFSPDGGTFAFEEYGVEDGSGFPYSNIYMIETDADEWVEGTPVRVRLEDDGASAEDARAEAKNTAQAFLDERQIESNYYLVASNPVTEV